jgi:hypothetical protein
MYSYSFTLLKYTIRLVVRFHALVEVLLVPFDVSAILTFTLLSTIEVVLTVVIGSANILMAVYGVVTDTLLLSAVHLERYNTADRCW